MPNIPWTSDPRDAELARLRKRAEKAEARTGYKYWWNRDLSGIVQYASRSGVSGAESYEDYNAK